MEQKGEGHYALKLEQQNARLNRDFVFYYRLEDNLPGRVELVAYRADHGKPGTFMECEVGSEGQVHEVRHVYDWAYQGSDWRQMPQATLGKLKETVRNLPKRDADPQREHVLILSHRDGDRWITRVFDRTAPPAEVRKLYELTKAYLSTDPVPP